MTASQHMVQSNGLRFRAVVDGPAQGELFLLLHGFPEGAESWSKQVDALGRAGFLAVAPDLRGYGLSDAPEGTEQYQVDHLVADVAGIVRAFGRTQAHIAGHDWGALVSWFLAGRHPEMAKSLTVLSCGHPAALAAASLDDADQQKRSKYVTLFLMQGKAEAVLAADDNRRLRAMFAIGPNPDAVPKAVVEHFVKSLSRPGRLTAALNYYRANLSPGTGWAGVANELKITTPTVLMWGDQDPAIGRRSAEDTAGHVSADFKLDVLAGAGHWLQFERPDEISRSLIEAAKH